MPVLIYFVLVLVIPNFTLAASRLPSENIYTHVINTHGLQTLQASDLFDPEPVAAMVPVQSAFKSIGDETRANIVARLPIADRFPIQHQAVLFKFP